MCHLRSNGFSSKFSSSFSRFVESQQDTQKNKTLREASSLLTRLIVELSNVFKSLSPNDKLRDSAEQLKILLTAETSFLVTQINHRTIEAQNTILQARAATLHSQAGVARIEQVTTQVDTHLIQIHEGVTRIEQRLALVESVLKGRPPNRGKANN